MVTKMMINNMEIRMDVSIAMVQKVLRVRLARLMKIEDNMIKNKPEECMPLSCVLWLEDINQVERLIHQTRGFLETRDNIEKRIEGES